MEPKNLLFIMSDEHNPHVMGCYDNPVAKTPNIDALAARGTRFTNAHCSAPICVPSRASFATGRYVHEIGAWDNAAPYTGEEAASWGHRLTSQGHKVTTVGKLHYRRKEDPTGFDDQRIPMHVLGGVGDLYALLRGEMPVSQEPYSRRHILEAGAGESEYIRYDRAIAEASARWLKEEAKDHDRPWVLFVSFATPHFPLVVPEEYFGLYPPDELPLPVQHAPEEWPRHPAIEEYRRLSGLEKPFDEKTVRNALAAYYGLVTFLDEQIGIVLQALDETDLRENTRIIYTSDHGDLIGEHGLWYKSSMYEGAVGVPMILAGPGVSEGKASATNVSLVDCYPSLVEAVGAQLTSEDKDLPGESLWELAREDYRARTVFAEYHAVYSPSGTYMVRDERYKCVFYVGYPPQLFDLAEDPNELVDLSGDPRYAETLSSCERKLQSIIDPEEVDRRAKEDQRRRIAMAGGAEAVIANAVKMPYTPAPDKFDPAQIKRRTETKA
jgi:choline-sulfatase